MLLMVNQLQLSLTYFRYVRGTNSHIESSKGFSQNKSEDITSDLNKKKMGCFYILLRMSSHNNQYRGRVITLTTQNVLLNMIEFSYKLVKIISKISK